MTGDMDPRPNPEREAAAPVAVVPRAPGVVVLPPRDWATPLVGEDIRGGHPVQPTRHGELVTPPPRSILMRVIWCLSGVVSILLACRFLLALAGAHRAGGFDRFITGSTAPLAAPFASLFGQGATPAVPRLDASTLVALIAYALAAWGLAGLVGLVASGGGSCGSGARPIPGGVGEFRDSGPPQDGVRHPAGRRGPGSDGVVRLRGTGRNWAALVSARCTRWNH